MYYRLHKRGNQIIAKVELQSDFSEMEFKKALSHWLK